MLIDSTKYDVSTFVWGEPSITAAKDISLVLGLKNYVSAISGLYVENNSGITINYLFWQLFSGGFIANLVKGSITTGTIGALGCACRQLEGDELFLNITAASYPVSAQFHSLIFRYPII